MTQETFPEIQAATQALEKQIELTETEIDQMKETIAGKKQLVRGWRKAIAEVSPKPPGQKKKAAAQ
jgi:5-bromo-4-chloroindolyl phosphate hydrolysis protein